MSVVAPDKTIYRLDEEALQHAKQYVQSRVAGLPKLAIILGSGLGGFADELRASEIIPTAEIPGYPRSTVAGHAGRWVIGTLHNKPVLAVQGRVHAYEGYPIQTVGFPVHLMAELGVKRLIVTNAAGGLNPQFVPGDLMLIADHINLMFTNPLRGGHRKEWGEQWPDMCAPFDAEFQRLALDTALELGIQLRHGVLIAAQGPSYETAAEIRTARYFGADAITMSTVPEVIVAASRRMRVLGLSCITNMATGLSHTKLDHREVTETAARVREQFTRLLRQLITRLG